MNLKVGDSAEFTKTISETDIYLYAGISGDFNPVHVNSEHAKNSFFKERIAHGMLSASLISTVLGTRLPGPGTIYLSQKLEFTAPVKAGDTVTAKVEVKEVLEKNRLRLCTDCINQKGETIIKGEAVVIPPQN